MESAAYVAAHAGGELAYRHLTAADPADPVVFEAVAAAAMQQRTEWLQAVLGGVL